MPTFRPLNVRPGFYADRMGKPLTNDFSWSKSRHEKLSECLRAYYFHYYRSWGGWEDTAPRDVRELYVLKKLGNRFTWAGSVVHDAIRTALMRVRAGREVVPHELIARVHQQMRDDFRHSREREYWREKNRRDFNGLVEHEYREAVADAQWKHNWEQAKAALEWFFRSRWIPLAKTLQPAQWLEVDDRSYEEAAFTLDGVKVFAVPDLAFIDADGAPVVVDWKTGKARDGYEEQVLGYALYLSVRYGFPVERVKASLVFLNDGLERMVQVDTSAVEAFKIHFAKSVAKMRALLAEGTDNSPKPEAHFARTEDIQVCARCPFRRPCGREQQPMPRVA